MKRIIIFLFAVLVITFTALITASASEMNATHVHVYIDGALMSEEDNVTALLLDGCTYVPLRRFCDSLGGAEVSWNNSTGTASVRSGGLEMTVKADKPYIEVNGRAFYTGKNNFLYEGNLYAPVRGMSLAYGLSVSWREATWDNSFGYVELVSSGSRAERAEDVYDSEVLFWLSRIISAESRGESLIGQIAVGNVVLNRTRDESFPDTVYDVIFDTKFGVQFTPTVNGTIYEEPSESSILAAKICLEGYTLSEDIIYFLNESTAVSLWVTNNRTYVMTLGNHAFYS